MFHDKTLCYRAGTVFAPIADDIQVPRQLSQIQLGRPLNRAATAFSLWTYNPIEQASTLFVSKK